MKRRRIVLIEARPMNRRGAYRDIADADKVITTDGRVIKDRGGTVPRAATPEELREAAMLAEGVTP